MSSDKLPTTLSNGMMLPHMSARRRHEVGDIVFEMLGGVQRLHHEANRDSDSYKWFVGTVWAKGLPRAVATESTNAGGVEDMLERLEKVEAAEKSKTIDGCASDITDVEP